MKTLNDLLDVELNLRIFKDDFLRVGFLEHIVETIFFCSIMVSNLDLSVCELNLISKTLLRIFRFENRSEPNSNFDVGFILFIHFVDL